MNKKSLLAASLTVMVALSGTSVFANDVTEIDINSWTLTESVLDTDDILIMFQEVLNEEASAGTITQEDADNKYDVMEKMQTHTPFIDENREEKKGGGKEELSQLTEEQRLLAFKEHLESEVEEEKITKEEADEKYAAMENGEFQPERKKQTIITKEERLALYKKILEKQVEEGTLTQTEADEKYNSAESTDFIPQKGPDRGKKN